MGPVTRILYKGVFVNTLTLTDIHTTWTECIAIIRRSADDVILALDIARQLLPFKMLGLDVDNGSEFINYDLLKYCEDHQITFTRSRPYRKNDQAHVEERNGSLVRRIIGYERYQTEQAWQAMCELYAMLRLYANFFQPSLKLLKKTRQGSRTTKHYQKAMTPYQRVMVSEHTCPSQKQQLREQFQQLDPWALKKKIQQLKKKLLIHAHQDNLTSDRLSTDQQQPKHEPPPKTKRHWKTRQDPFRLVYDDIEQEIQINPNVHGKEILQQLMEKYPGQFCHAHLRTLQRRVLAIREQQKHRQKLYNQTMISKKNMTTVTIEDNINLS